MAAFEFETASRARVLVPRLLLRLLQHAEPDADACAEVTRRNPIRPERLARAQTFAAIFWFEVLMGCVILALAIEVSVWKSTDSAVGRKAADVVFMALIAGFLYATATYGVIVIRASQLRHDYRAQLVLSGTRQVTAVKGLPRAYDPWIGVVVAVPVLAIGIYHTLA